MPFLLGLRLWDTYLAEGARMKEFLKYVLAAFLLAWSGQLAAMDFQARTQPVPPAELPLPAISLAGVAKARSQ